MAIEVNDFGSGIYRCRIHDYGTDLFHISFSAELLTEDEQWELVQKFKAETEALLRNRKSADASKS